MGQRFSTYKAEFESLYQLDFIFAHSVLDSCPPPLEALLDLFVQGFVFQHAFTGASFSEDNHLQTSLLFWRGGGKINNNRNEFLLAVTMLLSWMSLLPRLMLLPWLMPLPCLLLPTCPLLLPWLLMQPWLRRKRSTATEINSRRWCFIPACLLPNCLSN